MKLIVTFYNHAFSYNMQQVQHADIDFFVTTVCFKTQSRCKEMKKKGESALNIQIIYSTRLLNIPEQLGALKFFFLQDKQTLPQKVIYIDSISLDQSNSMAQVVRGQRVAVGFEINKK